LEFCVALPPAQKLGQGWSRLILRRAMAGTLPEQVRWRRGKADLGRNFLRRLLDRDGSLLDAIILNDSTAQPSCLDAAALRSAYQECRADPVGRRDTASQIFAAANLMLWLRDTGLTR
jgi:asparagine synthase (glutamine-hydrolysing)